MPRYLLGVDVGMTSIVGGLVSGEMVTMNVREPTQPREGFEASFLQILQTIERVIGQAGVGKQDIAGIGIRVPGQVDSESGMVVNLPEFPGWREVPLAQEISERFGLPVRVLGKTPLSAGLQTDVERVFLAATVWREEESPLGLRDFVLKHAVKSELGVDLIECGPGSRRLLERVGDKGRTRSLLTTNFWRAWLATDLAAALMTSLGASRGVFSRSRTIVVSVDDTSRFDMLVLDPALGQDFQPKSIGANLRGPMESIIMRGAVRAFADDPIPVLGTEAPQLAVEVSRNGEQPFGVVLAPEPAFERLSSASVPSPALSVDNLLRGPASTAGVLVEDITQPGRFGVTAALHAVETATTVRVGTHSGTVVRSDSVTDSAFIELSPMPSIPTRTVKNGVMSGLAPRGNQRAEFIGLQSKTCPTTVTGWDAQVPNPSSRRQACVYTDRDAQPGDSGSALITDDGWVVGFAFERTKPGESPAQCSWVWADSVVNRLKVKLV